MVKLVAEVSTKDVFDYLEDLEIDLFFRSPENYSSTMSFVENKPIVEIFDDAHSTVWYIDIINRKFARCKNGKWTKFYSVDTLDAIEPVERFI